MYAVPVRKTRVFSVSEMLVTPVDVFTVPLASVAIELMMHAEMPTKPGFGREIGGPKKHCASAMQVSPAGQPPGATFGTGQAVAGFFAQWLVASGPLVHWSSGPVLAPRVRFGDTPPVMFRKLLEVLGRKLLGTALLPPPKYRQPLPRSAIFTAAALFS